VFFSTGTFVIRKTTMEFETDIEEILDLTCATSVTGQHHHHHGTLTPTESLVSLSDTLRHLDQTLEHLCSVVYETSTLDEHVCEILNESSDVLPCA
jgi:hypothetical protein